MRTTPGLADQRQTLVEFVCLAIIRQSHTTLLRFLQRISALIDAYTRRVQGFNREQRIHKRQIQPCVHSLENTVITTTNRLRIKFLQTLSKEITAFTVLAIFAHFFDAAPQHFAHRLRLAWYLHRILRHVLDDSPQIHHRLPIHVT